MRQFTSKQDFCDWLNQFEHSSLAPDWASTANIVSVAATGPQGPSFAGSSFMDTAAIDALTSGDQGKVLEWNGSVFTPTDVLDDDLTLYGGAF